MAPPRLPKKLKRSVILRVKLRLDESRQVRRAARRASNSMAGWLRDLILRELGEEKLS
jgi:hypothetical protein